MKVTQPIRRMIPIEALPLKPRNGQPCNGCGYCCHQEVCGIGRTAGWSEAPCPGIWIEHGRAWCGLVVLEDASKQEPMIRNALGIGRGCCADDPV